MLYDQVGRGHDAAHCPQIYAIVISEVNLANKKLKFNEQTQKRLELRLFVVLSLVVILAQLKELKRV